MQRDRCSKVELKFFLWKAAATEVVGHKTLKIRNEICHRIQKINWDVLVRSLHRGDVDDRRKLLTIAILPDDYKESPMDFPIRSNIDIVDVCNEQVGYLNFTSKNQ